jgi:predicted RNase H-like HicB family nuclease
MKHLKIIIERHEDGYVGYPLDFTRGAIVGEGDTYAEALKDTESAIRFFVKHYGRKKFFDHLESDAPTLEAYIAETSVAI